MYQMLPKQRCRNITGLVYESDARQACGIYSDTPHGDNWYSDLVSYMCSLHVPCAVSPIHHDPYDQDDVNHWIERHLDPETGKVAEEYQDKIPAVGDEHENHVHIVFTFSGAKTRDQMTEYMKGYCYIRPTMWEEVKSVPGMLRYLCHLDSNDPSQIKYDIRTMYAFGGLDTSCCEKENDISHLRTLMDLTQYAEDNNIKHYSILVRKCLADGDVNTFKVLASRAPYFAAYFKGKSDERAEAAAKDKKASGSNG